VAFASIDIGSNSLVFLVVDRSGTPLHDESVIVGLGSGLGDSGAFAEGPMEASLQAFASFASTARDFGVDPCSVHAIATSAARRASNAAAFFERVERNTGIVVEIIDGLEEARLTWSGAMATLNIAAPNVAVVDLGGGSTEIVSQPRGWSGEPEQYSLEMGTVRLMEAFHIRNADTYPQEPLSAMQSHIDELVETVNWSAPPGSIIAVAGTATTIAAMEAGLTQWDRDKINGMHLSVERIEWWHKRLAASDHAQRLNWAQISPKRADLLVAGTAVLATIARAAGVDHLVISDGGIRHGVLVDRCLQNPQ